jgi:hypothetical protein
MKPSVLLLSTYPFLEPRHGGQVRMANIAQAFEAANWQVESLAVYEPEGYGAQRRGRRDLAFPVDSPYRQFKGRDVPLVNDLQTGVYAAADDGGFGAVVRQLPPRVDAIHVEQPWLWPLAKRIKQLPGFEKAILMYGSQNIEAPLKRDILNSYGVADAAQVVAEIDALERQAASEADVAVAVTKSDLATLVHWGARHAVLANNGISPWQATPERLAHWRARLPKAPWVLYVASAHPPNFTGFTDCVGPSLACFAPDTRLVVAGSVCTHLQQHLAATRWHSLNLSRLALLGVLSDEDLAAVKTLAHAFLLPILHGGGSNIKTAEALYAGAHVLGSAAAFRGFEDFLDLPEVLVARSPAEFQTSLRTVLARPRASTPLQAESGSRRDVLRWDRCLASIPAAAATALKGASA